MATVPKYDPTIEEELQKRRKGEGIGLEIEDVKKFEPFLEDLYAGEKASARESLTQRFSDMDRVRSGVHFTEAEGLEADLIERQKRHALDLALQQQQISEAGKESAIGKLYSTGERIGSEEAAKEQMVASQKFQTGERIAGQEFVSGERGAAEQFASGESVEARQWQALEAEKNKAYASGETEKAQGFEAQQRELEQQFSAKERESTQIFSTGERIASQLWSDNQTEMEQIWRSGERESSEAFTESQTILQQSWQAGQTQAKMEFEATESEFNRQHASAMDSARLAQQQGQFLESLEWEREAQSLKAAHEQDITQKRIDSEERMRTAELNYQKVLNGYVDEIGAYRPGIIEKRARLERAWQSGENTMARKLQKEIADMQLEAQKFQASATRDAGNATGWGQLIGSVITGGAILI